MKNAFILILLVFVFSCGSSNSTTKTDPSDMTATAVDCLSPSVQKTLTFCASPEAADLAKRNFDTSKTLQVPIDGAPAFGSETPLVTVVFFTDLQCSYCQAGHGYIKDLMKDPDVRVVYRHAPLPTHPDAIPAAFGALAAGEQGKFWEYVDITFENQQALTAEDLKKYAGDIGLDVAKWSADFAKPAHQKIIEDDIALAQNVGVEGTPTFFINGLRLVGLYPPEQFNGLIAEQKSLANRLVDAGVPRSDLYRRFMSAQYTAPVQGEQYEEEPQIRVAMVPIDDAPVKGSDDPLITIVEFSDFQCPFCSKANRAMEQFMETNKGDTRIAFKHFPLPFHENADITAAVAIVAHESGKFWKFHDLAFENQDRLTLKDLIGYARKSGLNSTKVKRRYNNEEVVAKLVKDIELAKSLGVQGTPTFFVNGIMYQGLPEAEFAELIKQQRDIATSIKTKTGLKGDALYEAIVKHNITAAGQ